MHAVQSPLISEEDEKITARLACEYFEAARDGRDPDVESYLRQLPNEECREMFRLSAGMSLALGAALQGRRPPASLPLEPTPA